MALQIIILLVALVLLDDKVCASCSVGTFNKRQFSSPVLNKTLQGSTISSLTVKDEKDCEKSCHMEMRDNCFKFNYCHDSKLCQLMYKGQAGQYKVVDSRGCYYRTRECEPTSSASCLNSIKCFMIADRKDACSCPPPLNITSCSQEGWIKVNANPVCLQAKNNGCGNFTIPYKGVLIGLKLVHISGKVLTSGSQWGYWGGTGPQAEIIEIFLTTSTNETISPPKDYPMISASSYLINAVKNVSPQIELPGFSHNVQKGSNLSVWFGEDLFDSNENDNMGTVCSDVFVQYRTW